MKKYFSFFHFRAKVITVWPKERKMDEEENKQTIFYGGISKIITFATRNQIVFL